MEHSERFLHLVNQAKQSVRECTVDEVRSRQEAGEALFFLDVREESEFAAGRAAGSVHLGRGILERDIEARVPDPDAPIVLYCGGGFRSALAADSLQRMGYRNVLSMAGGMRAWRDAGHPVER